MWKLWNVSFIQIIKLVFKISVYSLCSQQILRYTYLYYQDQEWYRTFFFCKLTLTALGPPKSWIRIGLSIWVCFNFWITCLKVFVHKTITKILNKNHCHSNIFRLGTLWGVGEEAPRRPRLQPQQCDF